MYLNLFDFYSKGYTVSKLPEDLVNQLWRIVYATAWKDDEEFAEGQIPTWIKTDDFEKINTVPLEHLLSKKNLFNAPLELKQFGQALLNSGYFDTLLEELITPYSADYKWLNQIEIISYLLRKNTSDLSWHTDYNGPEDFFVLIYLNDLAVEGGEIEFGIQDQNRNTNSIGIELPETGKIICVNCTNPYLVHRVNKNTSGTRYVLNIKFRINKL
jgi:hypothetical protein